MKSGVQRVFKRRNHKARYLWGANKFFWGKRTCYSSLNSVVDNSLPPRESQIESWLFIRHLMVNMGTHCCKSAEIFLLVCHHKRKSIWHKQPHLFKQKCFPFIAVLLQWFFLSLFVSWLFSVLHCELFYMGKVGFINVSPAIPLSWINPVVYTATFAQGKWDFSLHLQKCILFVSAINCLAGILFVSVCVHLLCENIQWTKIILFHFSSALIESADFNFFVVVFFAIRLSESQKSWSH